MLTPGHNYQLPAGPTTPAEHVAGWLIAAMTSLAVGFAIGWLAARWMRSLRLRWTWAATALAAVTLTRTAIGNATALTAGAIALTATLCGWRWHREDIETGADMSDIAIARRGPFALVRSLVRQIETCWGRLSTDSWFRGDRLVIGRERNGRTVTIPLGGESGGTHTLVVGATRSGKTVTMTWMAARAIERAVGTIVLDPKGDSALRHELREGARSAGSKYLEWTPQGGSIYNPYARGSETQIADKLLAGERFTEPHYLRQAQRYIGHVVRVLRKAGIEVSLRALVQHLDPSQLELLARSLPELEAQETHDYLDSLTPRQQNDLAGVRDRMAIMAESDIGDLLDPRTASMERLDLLEAAKAGSVVYFALEADSRPLLAQMLAAAIVQDLQATVAALQGRPVPTLVMIDEFSAIAPERVVNLFARAGGAGVSLVLGTQELADLRVPGREGLLEQILGNLSVLIAHRQVVPASADLIASMTEARGVWRTSRHSDGRFTRTRGFENALRAEQVMRLPRAWAAVVGLSDGGTVSVARIFASQHDR
jgi:type IV secretory pathway TraG/TraD family ATPase VirD4